MTAVGDERPAARAWFHDQPASILAGLATVLFWVALALFAELLAPFKANLKQELVTAMQQGPVEAIAACNTAAPAIAESLSVDGVRMGRSSHRLRNPENTAPEWLAAPMNRFADLGIHSDSEGKVLFLVTELEDGRTGYAEPIYIQPLCLTCHGETLTPELEARISELYPNDQATGFRTGDFRGMFWVEF